MKLTKTQKKEKAKELGKLLKKSPHLYFAGFQGMKFQEMAELRTQLTPLGCGFRVIKNSLLGHALKEAGVKIASDDLLAGPNALLFTQEDDPVSPAKILFKIAKDNENLKIKAGYVGGQWVDASKCKQLSRLGTRPELLTQLAGTLYSAVGQTAWVLAAPMQQLALVLQALQEKKKDGEKK